MIRAEKVPALPRGALTDEAEGRGFNYAGLDARIAKTVREATVRVKASLHRQGVEVIETGRDLLAVKDALEHGQFSAWVWSELGWAMTTAQNYMRAAAAFAGKSATVAHLPPTVIYKLASPSTPSPVREEIVRKIENGETISVEAIAERVAEAQAEQRRIKSETKLSPEQKKRRKEREQRRQREHEREIVAREEEDSRRRAAIQKAALMICDGMGEGVVAVIESLREGGFISFANALTEAAKLRRTAAGVEA